LLLSNEALGKNIAHYRKERKLTQANLAASVGMKANHISHIETARNVPGIHMLARLAAGLGVSIDELVRKR